MDTTAYGSYDWCWVSPNGEFNVVTSSSVLYHYQHAVVGRDIFVVRVSRPLLFLYYMSNIFIYSRHLLLNHYQHAVFFIVIGLLFIVNNYPVTMSNKLSSSSDLRHDLV